MTVPACSEHNNKFSELDEKFQFLIKSFRTNYVSENDLYDRVIRGLQRKEKEKFVADLDEKTKTGKINNQPHIFLELDKNEPELFIEKIVRGIYFYHNKTTVSGLIQSVSKRIIYDRINTIAVVDYLKENLNPQILTNGEYSNPEVFKYQYLEFEGMFVIFMQFYMDAEFIGWIYPEGFSFD